MAIDVHFPFWNMLFSIKNIYQFPLFPAQFTENVHLTSTSHKYIGAPNYLPWIGDAYRTRRNPRILICLIIHGPNTILIACLHRNIYLSVYHISLSLFLCIPSATPSSPFFISLPISISLAISIFIAISIFLTISISPSLSQQTNKN